MAKASSILRSFVCALVAAGCSSGEEPGSGPTTSLSPAATGGTGGQVISSSGAGRSAAGTSAVAGAPAATGGVTAAPIGTAGNGAVPALPGAGAPSSAGVSAPSGSGGATAAATGGTVAAPSGGAAAPGTGQLATEPVIPEIAGECPAFESGSATVMGARLTFVVAKKSEGTGTLVFYWHGTAQSPLEAQRFAGLGDIEANGGLVVGFQSSTGSGGDCSGTAEHAIDDFNVADQVVACGVKNFGIDPKRIYATGCSAGGLQSGCMGINRSAYIAAVVPNSGGVTIGYGPFQDPTRVPNVMTMHGRPGGDVVIVDFSQTSEAYDNYMLAKGAFAVNCNHGGGHCGAPAALQASGWQFMKDHPFGTHPSPYAGGLPSDFHDSCEIWQKTERQPLGEGRAMAGTPQP